MHLFCISYNETMSEYFDFLSELLEVEFALYFILSMISLITQFDVLIYRKQTFYFYFKNYILYLGLLLLILFFKKLIKILLLEPAYFFNIGLSIVLIPTR